MSTFVYTSRFIFSTPEFPSTTSVLVLLLLSSFSVFLLLILLFNILFYLFWFYFRLWSYCHCVCIYRRPSDGRDRELGVAVVRVQSFRGPWRHQGHRKGNEREELGQALQGLQDHGWQEHQRNRRWHRLLQSQVRMSASHLDVKSGSVILLVSIIAWVVAYSSFLQVLNLLSLTVPFNKTSENAFAKVAFAIYWMGLLKPMQNGNTHKEHGWHANTELTAW